MLGRAALVIPSIAVAVTAVVLLGPGATRPVLAVQLRGAPVDGGREFALRLSGIKRFYGVDEQAALTGLKLSATAGGEALGTWTGATGPDGIAEVQIAAPTPAHGRLEVQIEREGVRIAQGAIPLRRGAPVFATLGTIPGTLVAPAPGDLFLRVDATRGVLAAPFPATLRVSIADPQDSGLRADLEISAPGADLSADGGLTAAAPLKLSTDARGLATFTVKPLAHQVELTIVARAGEKSARWEGTLPVTPGAIWLAEPAPQAGAPLSITSPSPRERAYLSFFSEEGRVFGAVVPLSRDPRGFYQGQVAPVLPPYARLLYVSVAGDPREQGVGTVAFPLRPSEGAVAPRALELLLDGLPEAEAREKARAWAARRAGLLVVAAAALLTMLLILQRSQASQRKLEAHLIAASTARTGGEQDKESARDAAPALSDADQASLLAAAREQPLLRVLVALAVVGLAFAIMGALSTFR